MPLWIAIVLALSVLITGLLFVIMVPRNDRFEKEFRNKFGFTAPPTPMERKRVEGRVIRALESTLYKAVVTNVVEYQERYATMRDLACKAGYPKWLINRVEARIYKRMREEGVEFLQPLS